MSDESTQDKNAEAAQAEDQNTRVNSFLKEYGELVEKHKMDFASYPMWVPDGQGGFKTILQNSPVDVSNVPVKSPVIVTA